MTTLVMRDSPSKLNEMGVIAAPLRAYFQQRLFSRVHQLLLAVIRSEEGKSKQFSKRQLAKRIEKKPEQITRWLSYPGNMTLETLSDLMVGMCCEIDVDVKSISNKREETIRSYENIIIGDFKIVSQKVSDKVNTQKTLSFVNSSANTKTFITPIEVMQNG